MTRGILLVFSGAFTGPFFLRLSVVDVLELVGTDRSFLEVSLFSIFFKRRPHSSLCIYRDLPYEGSWEVCMSSPALFTVT